MNVRIPLNLSSEPFRRDRPMLAASVATAVLMVVILGFLVTTILRNRDAARENREAMAETESQMKRINSEYARLEAELRKPENSAVLERSAFLNSLLQRKGISWTRMFEDLDKVLPGSVRLVAVRPYVTGDNAVQLDMIVGSQSPGPVIELLRRLEKSQVFGATSLLNSSPPTQNEPLYRYRVSVNYAQKL